MLVLILFSVYLYSHKRKSNDNIPPTAASGGGQTMEVVYAYSPNLSDELALQVGDLVLVKSIFDDGWY